MASSSRPAAVQVIQRYPAGGREKLKLEPAAGRFDEIVQRLLPLEPLAVFRCRLRHLQPGLGRQLLDRFGKRQIVVAHREADDVAMGAAAEAVEEALLVVDVEAGRLLVVERARRLELAPRPDQPHALADHVGQGQPCPQLFKELRRKRHGLRLTRACEERLRGSTLSDVSPTVWQTGALSRS